MAADPVREQALPVADSSQEVTELGQDFDPDRLDRKVLLAQFLVSPP